MNSRVEVIADFIKNQCKKNGVVVNELRKQEPIDYISIYNNDGDIASISASSVIFEPASYSPKWSAYIKKWAKEEGFSEEQIKSQNLIQQVSPEQAVYFLC